MEGAKWQRVVVAEDVAAEDLAVAHDLWLCRQKAWLAGARERIAHTVQRADQYV